ncbi:MAG: 50S ribosomal protein L5 [Dehalococcoidia bacterium]
MPGDNRVKTKKKAPSKGTDQNGYEPRLKTRYRDEILPALVEEIGYSNPMQAPRVEKIVLNIGLGEALENAKAVESATRDLEAITGQHPIVTRARKSIANFKVREGMIVGIMVTLRGARMYEFLDRLLNASLPRIRDFRGLSLRAFDGRGNYSLGLREQTMFPEIDYDSMDRLRGLQISIVTSARTDNEAQRLLAMMGMPFARTDE